MGEWAIGATQQAGRLRPELVVCVLVRWMSPDLGYLAVTKVKDDDHVFVQLLARSLAAGGNQGGKLRSPAVSHGYREELPIWAWLVNPLYETYL